MNIPNKTQVSLYFVTAVFLISGQWGCATAPEHTGQNFSTPFPESSKPSVSYAPEAGCPLEPVVSPDAPDQEALAPISEPEPELFVDKELNDLASLGHWEEGVFLPETGENAVKYDFPVTINKQVEYYLTLFQTDQKEIFSRWLARSTRYLPMIREQLAKAGLPLDLAYLAMIESGYWPTAISKASAVGLWQFMAPTGREYGLQVSDWVDERRDPEKATQAAAAYLSGLFLDFNNWYLAVAAYNAGPRTINTAVDACQTNNFWQLAENGYLPPETRRYVPKLLAAIIIAKNPTKYGFTDIPFQPGLAYESIDVPRGTSLKAVSVAGKIDEDILCNLNCELIKGVTPNDHANYPLKVPVGHQEIIAKNLSNVATIPFIEFKTHVVKKGETINQVCRRYDLSKTSLLKANNLRVASLSPGQRLRIPYQTVRYELIPEGTKGSAVASAAAPAGIFSVKNSTKHRVKKGETIYKLAKQYNVPVDLVAKWNGLKETSRIKAGDELTFYVQEPPKPASSLAKTATKQSRGEETKVALASDKKATPPLKDKNKRPDSPKLTAKEVSKITYYRVQGGDTLWNIAQRYNVTPNAIREWNNMDNDSIYPGLQLILKVLREDA